MSQRGLNKVMIIGHLGKDPEVRYLPSGECVVNFSVATSEVWKDKETGEQKEQTEWHRISAFGKLAQIIAEYLRKGSKVYIEGKLKTRSWEDKGEKKYMTEIRAEQMQMLDGAKADGDQEHRQQQQPKSSQQSKPKQQQGGDFDFDDSIPF